MTATPPPPTDPTPRKLWFDWTDRDQRVLLVLSVLVFAGIGAQYLRWRWQGAAVVEIDRLPERKYDFKVDINKASWIEWMQLEGIGELLARRIEEDRQTNGPFASVDDLDRVEGIGTVTLDTIRPWLICSDCKVGTTH
jgi:competence protein ComEA